MSTLLRVLLALLAALSVSVAVWAGLCAAGVEHARIAASTPEVTPPTPTVPPARSLPRVPTTVEASAVRTPRPRAGLQITLRGSPAPARGAEGLVLTVFDAWTAAPIATASIDAAALAAGTIAFPDLPRGPHRVTIASSAAAARHRYLTGATVQVGDGASVGDLDATVGDLRVVVRDSRGEPAVDVLVVAERVDDPAWRCPPAQDGRTAHSLTNAEGRTRLGPVGAGRYRVRALLADGPAVDVEFPAAATATINLRPTR